MAARFDASADALSRTTNLPTIASFAVLGWFYPTSFSTYNIVFTYGGSSGAAYTAQLDSGAFLGDPGSLEVYNGSSAYNSGSLGTVLPLNAWSHVAMTVSGTGAGQFLCYLDGALNITGNAATISSQKILIGNDTSGTGNVASRFAAVKVYGAVLTAAEVQQEMRQYLPVRTANLNTFLPLCGPASEFPVDFSGNGFAMTAGGTLTSEDGPPIPWKRGRSRLILPATAAGPAFVAAERAPILQAVNRASTY
jgi:hypothetical protein